MRRLRKKISKLSDKAIILVLCRRLDIFNYKRINNMEFWKYRVYLKRYYWEHEGLIEYSPKLIGVNNLIIIIIIIIIKHFSIDQISKN